LSRDRAHEHGGGIAGLAARRIDAGALYGRNTPAEDNTVFLVLERDKLFRLLLVIASDAVRGLLKRRTQLRGEAFQGLLTAVVTEEEVFWVSLLEAFDVAAHRYISLIPDVFENRANGRLHAGQVCRASAHEGGESVTPGVAVFFDEAESLGV
jgi:hypothetical protein